MLVEKIDHKASYLSKEVSSIVLDIMEDLISDMEVELASGSDEVRFEMVVYDEIKGDSTYGVFCQTI